MGIRDHQSDYTFSATSPVNKQAHTGTNNKKKTMKKTEVNGLETYHENRIQVRATDNLGRNNDNKGAATVGPKVRPGLTEKPHELLVSHNVDSTRLRVGFCESVSLHGDFLPPIERHQRRIHRSEGADSLYRKVWRRREFSVDMTDRKGRSYGRDSRHGRRGGLGQGMRWF